jgi:hypothetical protein
LLAVSDSSFRVFTSGTAKGTATARSRKLDAAVDQYTKGDASEWEGIASDASERIFVLQERPGHIFIFDAVPDQLVGVLALEVPDTGAEWERRWREDDNPAERRWFSSTVAPSS